MFGTIGRAHLKSGHQAAFTALMEAWTSTIRPRVPGAFLQLRGHRSGAPEELIFVALAHDEATYRALAAMPEQDAWYRRMLEHIEGEPSWEDAELELTLD